MRANRIVIAGLCLSGALYADLPRVLPEPRTMDWANGQAQWLAVDAIVGIAAVSGDRAAIDAGIEQVNSRLKLLNRPALSLLSGAPSGVAIRVGVQPDAALEKAVAKLPVPKEQGYRLLLGADGGVILGADAPGLYYGLVTLSALYDAEGRLPCVAVSDWPDLRIRGTYTAGLGDWETIIPRWAAMKINLAMFESDTLYQLDDPKVRERWQNAFALCRKHFIEPVPELQSLGWGHYILQQVPEAAEGITLERQPFPVADGRVQSPDAPIPPELTVVNAGFEEGEGTTIPGWQQDPPGTKAAIDKTVRHEGAAAIRLHTDQNETLRVWQDLECKARERYEVACFLKTEHIVGQAAYIEIYGLTKEGELGVLIGRDAPKLAGTNDWQRTATKFETRSYERIRVYIRIQEASGTAWFDEVSVAGVQAPNPLANVIVTEATPVIVQDASGKTTYEAGRDFTLEPAAIVYPYESGAALGIAIPKGSRIHDGDTVLLTYTYAPPESITCCPSEPRYQAYMRKAVHNAIEHLKPKYVHIGHDEPRLMCRDARCLSRNMSAGEIFVDDIKKLRGYATEANPDVRIMMWSDAVNPYQNGPMLHMEDAAKDIPRDVIICDWWYEERDYERLVVKSTEYFLDLGFEFTGSPWFDHRNVHRWAETLCRFGKDNPRVLGEIYTSWAHPYLDPWQALPTAAEYSWTVDKPPFDAYLERVEAKPAKP